MPIFCVKSVKIYTGQKNLHWRRQWRQWQLSGMRKKPKVIRYCVENGSFQDNLVLGAIPYLEWTPSSNILEDVIKVLDNFFLFVFHDWWRLSLVDPSTIFLWNLFSEYVTKRSWGFQDLQIAAIKLHWCLERCLYFLEEPVWFIWQPHTEGHKTRVYRFGV